MGFSFQLDSLQRQREEMVRTQLADRGIRDLRVLEAMQRVPRHEFVPQPLWNSAYEDRPLPIGEGQTISQPYIVAAMLERLALQGNEKERVLEVGTGSGYVTALLSLLSGEVYSVERHAPLAASAESTLQRLEYRNVKIRVGDGSQGWPEYAPFDAILISAATHEMPPALFAQLREGGRMMVPIGPIRQSGFALDPQSRWTARSKNSRRLPVRAAGDVIALSVRRWSDGRLARPV
jgi:protein-L-isoaspartate(D-aspartate) O-methyltransferase